MTLEDIWAKGLRDAAHDLWKVELPPPLLEPPSDPKFGDATCSAPMRLAKELRKPPRAIAEDLAKAVRNLGLPKLAKVEVAGAGYINLTATPEFHAEELSRILAEGPAYGRSTMGTDRKVLVEHCSANPTGPLHIAHGRQAAVGDSLANILDFAGFRTSREFYINDTGNQIEMLGRSILWRLYESEGRTFRREERGTEVDEKTREKRPLVWLVTDVDGARFEILENNAYKGDYIRALAAELKGSGRTDLENAKRLGVDRLLGDIRKDLVTFRVKYDHWQSEEELHRSGKVEELLNFYSSWGYTYTQDGALFAKFKDFGDTEDRPVVKKDGSYVYRLPDIAYHKDKFDRGFDTLVDLWGPDHHAHIANVAAGLKMRGFNLVEPEAVRPAPTLPPDQRPVAFKVLIIQHCTLYQGGVELKMSKRAASYVTLRELMDEVGVDATRFFFAMRKPSSHLDFDLDVAKKQSADNPYYYAGYAHARICSILEKGIAEKLIDPGQIRGGVWAGTFEASRLGPEEIELLKVARQFRRRVEIAARDLDPAVMTEYLKELSTAFQKYYEYGNRDASKRTLTPDAGNRSARLAVCSGIQQVLRNGFGLLGLVAPERM